MRVNRDQWMTPAVGNLEIIDAEECLIEIDGVAGYLLVEDIFTLIALLEGMPQKSKILEIGSFMGLSALLFAKALYASQNYSTRIYCVDTWGDWSARFDHPLMKIISQGKIYEKFLNNISDSGLENFIIPIRKDSVETARDFPDENFDLIFIDGDHTVDGAYRDLSAWHPKLKPGGILVGHDYFQTGVQKAVHKYTKERNLSCILFGVGSVFMLVPRDNILANLKSICSCHLAT